MIKLIIKGLNGEIKEVDVNPDTRIGELKTKCAILFGVRPSQIKLSITNGQSVQLDDDQRMVSEYGLSSGATVILFITKTTAPFQVFVKNEKGQTKTYDVTENETVDQLKTKVRQKEGTPEDQQRLIFNGKQLDSGRQLVHYGIEPLSTIHMTLRLRGG